MAVRLLPPLKRHSVPVGNMASGLSRLLGGTVIDKTGLTGNFDISMEWIPDESQTIQLSPEAARSTSSDAVGGSIFTALKDQLGLKLESQKSPVEVLTGAACGGFLNQEKVRHAPFRLWSVAQRRNNRKRRSIAWSSFTGKLSAGLPQVSGGR